MKQDDDPTATTANEAPADADETEQPPSFEVRGPVLALLILVVLLAGVALYWLRYLHAPQTAALEERITRLEAGDSALAAAVETNGTALSTLDGAQQSLRLKLRSLSASQASLEESMKALFAREAQASIDWVLAEAEYLVLAASQRLALERDVRTAVAALAAADKRLRSAEHPELIALREQLARDVAALEAVAMPDVEGLAVYLAEAIGRVDDLPTKPIADLDMSFSRTRDEAVGGRDWKETARAMWADLVSLVEVKDGDLPDGVLFDPELRYFLKQNLRLELASARLSVLRRDDANFRAATRLVADLLERYYDTSNSAVAALIERLAASESLELDPAVPDISGSLNAIRAKRLALRDTAAGGAVARN